MKIAKFMKSILLFAALGMLVTGCGASTPLPEGDGYVDVLPSTMDDGVFLQAFNWKYNQVLENLPTLADQGFKGVQLSPVQKAKSNGSQWAFLYQPVSFSVAETSPLGTKEELSNLCTEAEKYGIDIIVDVVANHMATTGKRDETTKLPIVDPEVEQYEPYIYNNQTECFHQLTTAVGSGGETQVYPYGVLPDLNTGNEYVQSRVRSFLYECIDLGVDGFRFDAAKHIETPDDPNYPSDFWPNTLVKAKEYYKEKTGHDLYAYGEILGGLGTGRSDMSIYTKYMKITDDGYIGQVNGGISSNAELVASSDFTKKAPANQLVTWVYSHDSYEKTNATAESQYRRLSRQWAVIASRKDSNAMFLAAPDDDKTVGVIGSYDFELPIFGAINRFHNRFAKAEENIFAIEKENVFINERYTADSFGAIAVNVKPSSGLNKSLTFDKLEDGEYFDQVTNRLITIKDKKASITFDETGVAVLTKTNNSQRPTISVNNKSCDFQGSITININVNHSENTYYQIDGGEKVEFNSSTSVVINKDGTTRVLVHAEKSGLVVERMYVYKKINITGNGFNILNLNPSYLTDYELYYWAWPEKGSGKWFKEYTVVNGNLIIDFPSNMSKFLLAIFKKGYSVKNVNSWDSSVIKQTGDIDIKTGYYDASDF